MKSRVVIFRSHFVLLLKFLSVIVFIGGGFLFYRMGDNFFVAFVTLIVMSFGAAFLASLFLSLKDVRQLKASGLVSLDKIENGKISTDASLDIVASILLKSSFNLSDGLYHRAAGFYGTKEKNENFPSIRIALSNQAPKGTQIELLDVSSQKLTMHVQVYVFIAEKLSEQGHSICFSK